MLAAPSRRHSALVIDPEPTQEMLSSIGESSGTSSLEHQVPAFLARNGQEGEAAILDHVTHYSAIFIDPVLTSPGGIRLIALAHRHRPATPLYALYKAGKTLPFSRHELPRIAVLEAIPKPLSLERVIASVPRTGVDLGPRVGPASSTERVDGSEYLAISAADFLTCAPSLFDVYLKLPSGKFVKILDAKDTFTPDRVTNYLMKGADFFYIRAESYHRCLIYCDLLMKRPLERAGISFELKLSEAMNCGQDIIQLVARHGLSAERIDDVNDFLDGLRRLHREIKLETRQEIREFLDTIENYEHAVAVTVVAALLTKPLQIETSRAYRTVGMAAFLHDIGLYRLPKALDEREELTHAKVGAGMLAQFEEIDPTVVQAVSQHHRRRNTHEGDIAPIAEIVGIADEFVHWVGQAKRDASVDPFDRMREISFHGFSFPVIDAFNTVFFR